MVSNLLKFLSLFFLIAFVFAGFQFIDPVQSIQQLPGDKQLVVKKVDNTLLKKVSQGLVSEKKKKVKGLDGKDNPNLFAEWHNGIRTGLDETKSSYPLNYQVKELIKARNKAKEKGLSKTGVTRDWIERGPGNVAGRTRGLLVDPRDESLSTWIVGSVGGGVWKTTDAGVTWTHLTNDLPNLATSTLAWSPSNYDVIYAGTGEGFGNVDQIDGSGIWKTTNGGTDWLQLDETTTNPEFDNIMRIIVDPSNPDIVLAAVGAGFNYLGGEVPSSGIYRSTNGGMNWTKTYTAVANVEDLVADPTNFNIQYATVNSTTVVKSIDGGLTWNDSGKGIIGVARMEIAVAPSDPDRLYISAEGGPSGSILFRSDDGGANWFANSDISGVDIDWLGGQGWYDNTIAVNPYNKEQVFVGGINIWQLDTKSLTDTVQTVLETAEENTQALISFVFSSGSFFGGGGFLGANFLGSDALESDFSSVELRFGPGKSQKAHMFNSSLNTFTGYVDVPFEVWDITNTQQLMVSFRDWENNGVFDLQDRATAASGLDREYVFVSSFPYDDTNPEPTISDSINITSKNTYGLWMEAPAGVGTSDFSTLASDATLRIVWGNLISKTIATTNITDGYLQFGGTSKGVHVDQHNIVLVKSDEQNQEFFLLNGNDGGISFSRDGGATFSQTGDWRGITGLKGYNTTQFYGIDKANGVDRYIGGMQDNGSWYSPENANAASVWTSAPSGDGYEAVWHYNDINKMIESSQFNSIYKSINGGASWTSISPPDPNGGPFFTKIAKSKQDPDLIFAVGGSGVWRSDNFGDDWTLTKMPSGFNGTNSFSQIKISQANPQIVWSARNMTSTSPPYVSTDGGLTFNATTNFEGVNARISGFETHPTDENTAYTLLSVHGKPKVLRTTDLGQTWEELSGFGTNGSSSNGFPDAAVYSLLVMPFDTDIIWAGTEIGIFESLDGGATWTYADNGFPAASVYDMIIVNNEVVVATHGRGVWTVEFSELQNYEPLPAVLSPRLKSIGEVTGMVNVTIKLPSVYDSTQVNVNGTITKIMVNEMDYETTIQYVPTIADSDTVMASVVSYKDGEQYKSSPRTLLLIGLNAVADSYESDFVNNLEDFAGSGYSITQPAGFSAPAIHSIHPYTDAQDFIYTLKTPIRVAATNAKFEYSDIAIVEPGNDGSVFGGSTFWDYVVVEGSTDGINWIPFADGYDARFNEDWESLYTTNNSVAITDTLWVKHDINMLDSFSAGDEVIIRFRLHADDNTNGWGWAIDDINIQSEITSIDELNEIPTVFSLSQNYPNPFNPTTKIDFSLPVNSKVKLKIFDITGREVATLINAPMTAGSHTFEWQAENFASGTYIYRIEAGNFVKTRKMLLLK